MNNQSIFPLILANSVNTCAEAWEGCASFSPAPKKIPVILESELRAIETHLKDFGFIPLEPIENEE